MPEHMEIGKPFWLLAYPNEGTLDYFGFRFYRQPLRAYLVRGAGANDFKNAKTLIYYAAITYGFRQENSISINSDLSEKQLEKWKDWYKSANYLYIINRYSKHREVPDRGFTGAIDESQNYFKEFFDNSTGQFNIKDSYSRIYPDQREWGYLAQFWRPPLDYFRCVLDIAYCTPGEYGKDCYSLLSSYANWDLFVKILNTGVLERKELSNIQNIIDSKELNADEQKLARKIIFDEENITDGENDEYKKSFRLLKDLQENGCEKFAPLTKTDYAMVFSYAHLKNLSLGENDLSWKVLTSSITFEIGINRFYTLIAKISQNGTVDILKLKEKLRYLTEDWMKKNDFYGDLAEVENRWKCKYLSSIDSYGELFERMLDYSELDCCFDGLLQGYIISKIKVDTRDSISDSYQVLTDQYHYFAPQPFFTNKKIFNNLNFKEFIIKMALWLVDEQFEFSLDRMNYGQKAKFILSKSEFSEQYLFQIDAREFRENRGIIEMIDACLNLWRTAGLMEKIDGSHN